MRPWWLTTRIILLFGTVMGLVLTGTLLLFIRVFGLHVGHGPGGAMNDVVLVAEQVEQRLQQEQLVSPALQQLVERRANELGIGLRLVDLVGATVSCGGYQPPPARKLLHRVRCRGRVCEWLGPPALEIRVPVSRAGSQVGALVATASISPAAAHRAFQSGLLLVGAMTLVAVIGLSFHLTRPLRRMSSSMDQIAAGDLSHRVPIQSAGEVAQMGHSFNAMADRIEHMVVGQKELLAGVSHELRSPLARMKMSLELARDAGTWTPRLAELEAEVEAINELVEEVLVTSRLELGATPLQLQPHRIATLAGQAWQRVAAAACSSGLQLRSEIDDDAALVEADGGLVVRAIGNLFENAVRYAAGQVSLRAVRDGMRVRVTVSDDGPGVAEEHLERLFEPFYRADPSRSRRTGATGLGLMIVRRAMEAHGGRVDAGRASCGGLAITFDLPAAGREVIDEP